MALYVFRGDGVFRTILKMDNQKSLLGIHHFDNYSPGDVTGGKTRDGTWTFIRLVITRDANLVYDYQVLPLPVFFICTIGDKCLK